MAYLGSGVYLLAVLQRSLKTTWKTLLVPSTAELRAYGRFWYLFWNRFGLTATGPRTPSTS
jgi:hypothetical protein